MSQVFITNGQTGEPLTHIRYRNVLTNSHKKSLEDNSEVFDFSTHADKHFSEHIKGMNRVVIPGEDGEFLEFIIYEVQEDRIKRELEVYSYASYADLINAKSISPHTTGALSAEVHANLALSGTEWEVGNVDFKGVRTIIFENYTNPYAYLKRIATSFELELNFRVEHNNGKVTGRYVDLVEKVGRWRGRRVEFGKDLIGLRRIENTDNIVTALRVIGPVQEDGTRLEILVEDKDALLRWGRNGRHIIKEYEPQFDDPENATIDRLKELGEQELDKRVKANVSYEITIADLENSPGMENKKIRFGDTIPIKDISYEPALYLEARVYFQDRDIKEQTEKKVILGDFIEYTEEEVHSNWNQLQSQITRIARNEVQKVTYTKPEVDQKVADVVDDAEQVAVEVVDGIKLDIRNLFIESTSRDGFYNNDGSYNSTNSSVRTSDFIEVISGEEYIINKYSEDGFIRLAQFDESMNFISRILSTEPHYLYVPDENVRYIAVGVEKTLNVKVEKGNKPTGYSEALEDVQAEIENAESSAKGYADSVSETAYLDAIADAEEYLEQNGIVQGAEYNGVSISNEDGFVTVRGDGLVRTAMNSTLGYVIQRRKSLDDPWENILYFDTEGNAKYAGIVEGVTGRFGEVTVNEGEFLIESPVTKTIQTLTPKTNMIKNHSFETVEGDADPTFSNGIGQDGRYYNALLPELFNYDGDWLRSGSPKVAGRFDPNGIDGEFGIFGTNVILVDVNDYVFQYVSIEPNKTYTLSFYNSTAKGLNTGAPRAIVEFLNNDTLISTEMHTGRIPEGDVYERNSMTFTTPSNANQIRVILTSSANSYWVEFDGVQLVEGEYMAPYQTDDNLYQYITGSMSVPKMDIYDLRNNTFQSASAEVNELLLPNGLNRGRIYLNNNNQIVISGAPMNIGTGLYSYGIYTTTTSNAANVALISGYQLARSTSSIKYKKDVEDLWDDLAEKVLELRPIWYRDKATNADAREDWSHWGFIAEEVHEVEPRLVQYKSPFKEITDEEGSVIEKIPLDHDELEPEGVKYERITVGLVSIVKKQKNQLEEQDEKITKQQEVIDSQGEKIKELEKRLAKLEKLVGAE